MGRIMTSKLFEKAQKLTVFQREKASGLCFFPLKRELFIKKKKVC